MSKIKFFKKFFKNRKEIGAIIPSSRFLSKKMIKQEDILKAEVILEFGAGTGSFTKKIFEYIGKNKFVSNEKSSLNCIEKKIFIIEKDLDLYNLLLKKFPKHKKYIYNIDILDLHEVLKKNNITKVDLIISGLPFKSLPLEIYYYVTKKFLPDFSYEKTIFIQFSYFKNFGKILSDSFSKIKIKSCFLNVPKAYIFRCTNFYEKNK